MDLLGRGVSIELSLSERCWLPPLWIAFDGETPTDKHPANSVKGDFNLRPQAGSLSLGRCGK
jgi:hypothetical protein